MGIVAKIHSGVWDGPRRVTRAVAVLLSLLSVLIWPSFSFAQTGGQAQSITWSTCPTYPGLPDAGMLCGTVSVPLDYRNPAGPHIDIAVSKIPAANPAQRRGVLLVNPGGPGGAGLNIPRLFTLLWPQQVFDTYDVIGFDPRGVGESTPVTCDLTSMQAVQAFPTLTQSNSFAATVAWAQTVADDCTHASGQVLPYITTANTARDMDVIRQALGETKISYYGLSYGTYLGSVYASLFPNQTDRLVLDSNVDPQWVWRTEFRGWALGGEVRFQDFAQYAAANAATYHLGNTPADVTTLFFQTVAQLNQHPVSVPDIINDGTLINGEFFRELVFSGLDFDSAFSGLGSEWDEILQAEQGVTANQANGAPVTPADTVTPADNQMASGLAIVCDDVAWPTSVSQYQQELTIDSTLFPMFAPLGSNIEPCAFWPNSPKEPLVAITATGPSNILLLQNLRDQATLYPGALQLHADLGQRSRLISVDEGGHGIYGFSSNQCVLSATTAYLVSGTFPTTDLFCPAETTSAAGAEAPAAAALPNATTKQRAVTILRRLVPRGLP